MRNLILLLLMVLSSRVSAQPANELAEALRAVLDGRLETHFNLPVDNPVAYAFGFEYLDELDRLCPGNTPDNLVGIRDTMYNTFAAYKLLFVKGEKLPAGTTFMEGVAVLLARIPEAVAPVLIGRNRIKAVGPQAIAVGTVDDLGGCNAPAMKQFIANLAAIATFGRIRHRIQPMAPEFVRDEVVANGSGRVCYYEDDPANSSEILQGYKTITMINFARAISPLEILVMNLQALPGQPADQPLFMRYECPATPDPAFPSSKVFVEPKESGPPPLGNSAPERIADYFINDLIPKAGEHLTGVKANVDAAFLADLRQEIINFESLPVPLEEIQREIQAFKKAEAERGAQVVEPDWKLEQQFESHLRIQKYKAKYGTKLFDMAASPEATRKGIPNYLAMRDVEPLVDMRVPT